MSPKCSRPAEALDSFAASRPKLVARPLSPTAPARPALLPVSDADRIEAASLAHSTRAHPSQAPGWFRVRSAHQQAEMQLLRSPGEMPLPTPPSRARSEPRRSPLSGEQWHSRLAAHSFADERLDKRSDVRHAAAYSARRRRACCVQFARASSGRFVSCDDFAAIASRTIPTSDAGENGFCRITDPGKMSERSPFKYSE